MNDASCLFCRIVAGAIPADVAFQDDHVMAFRDIAPQAPTHLLIIPKIHVTDLADIAEEDPDLSARLLATAVSLAAQTGLDQTGYRLVTNTGADGGQSVAHLHWHLLGGRAMRWPPG